MKGKVLGLAVSLCFVNSGLANNHKNSAVESHVYKSAGLVLAASLDNFNPVTHDYRVMKIRKGIESHNRNKPKNWNTYLAEINEKKGNLEKLMLVNKIVNRIPYIDDTDGTYFSPAQMERRGGAVCKDFAEYKYILLRESGFNPKDMFFIVLKPKIEGGYWHVTLAVRENNQVYVLEMPSAGVRYKKYAEMHTTKDREIRKVQKNGVELTKQELDEIDFMDTDGFQTIEKYKWGVRNIDWIGNENDAISDLEQLKKKVRKA